MAYNTKRNQAMKSQYPYYLQIYDRLLADICSLSGLPLGTPDITDDWVLIEGPKLDKELLRYLEGDGDEPSFPEWIQPLSEAFLLSKEPRLLKLLRQLLVFCYKTEKEPNDAQLSEAQASFVDTDESIAVWDGMFNNTSCQRPYRFRLARHLISRITCKIRWAEIIPSHGPGSVYPNRRSYEKSKLSCAYRSILEHYPLDTNYCALPSFWDDVLVKGDSEIQLMDAIESRLVAVPKDARGPRLICVHPAAAIWIQQGQRRLLEHAIECSPLTRGHINFTDQTVNGMKALEASLTQEYVTLDLSEASDRISCELIRYLFGDYVYSWLSCSRATHVRLLDGRVHSLKKFAPMGNALTFPVESLVFWALVVSGIKALYGENCTEVFVFGDDIIYPAKYHQGVIQTLTSAGMKPNAGKTFVKGLFRESCGVDAFNGIDVTPLRVRQGDINTVRGMVSNLELAKRLRIAGYEWTASWVYSRVRLRLGYLPLCNNPQAQGLYEYVPCRLDKLMVLEPRLKWRKNLHTWSVQCRQVKGCFTAPPQDDWYHLQDSLLKLERAEVSDRGLEYPLPYAAQLGYGWIDAIY